LPSKWLYNEHFSITVTNEEDEPYTLPYYFDAENDGITIKNDILIIRVFNSRDVTQTFKVGIILYHGLFIPYLEGLTDMVWIEIYEAQR